MLVRTVTRLLALGLAALCASGCATAYVRASRELGAIEGLAYSNSPVVIEERMPQRTPEGLVVHYTVLLANQAEFPVTVVLAQALATLDGEHETTKTRCQLAGHRGTLVPLSPGERGRIECWLQLTPTGLQRLRQGDRDLQLAIPVQAPVGNATLQFGYALRLEDAS